MADRIKGITVQIGGDTTGLSKALGGVNRSINDTQSQLKDVERLLKFDPTNTELLAQKQRLLTETVKETKAKLDALKNAEEQIQQKAKEDKASQEKYEALQREIIATEQSLENLEKQADQSNEALSKIEDVAETTSKASEKIASAAGNISKATAPLTVGITALGVKAFGAASEIQDALGATEQIFGSQADSVAEWAESLESYYGIAKGEALGYANTMGAMLKNIGNLTEEEAAAQAQTLIKLAGDLTAMYGGTTADAVYALTGALKGNNTMLDNYGMAVNENLIKTKALEMGLISEGEQVDLASKQAATLALIMEQAADATGQAAREADGASGSIRAAQTDIKNITTEIGENLIPIVTPLIQKVSEAIKTFGSLDDNGKKVVLMILALVAAISPVAGIISAIATIVPILTTAFTALNAVMAANPVGILCIAFIALIAIITQLWTHSEAFRNFWIEVWNNIVTAFVLSAGAVALYEMLYIIVNLVFSGAGNPIRQIFAFYLPSFIYTMFFVPIYYYIISQAPKV